MALYWSVLPQRSAPAPWMAKSPPCWPKTPVLSVKVCHGAVTGAGMVTAVVVLVCSVPPLQAAAEVATRSTSAMGADDTVGAVTLNAAIAS